MTKSNNEWVPEIGVCCEWLRDKRVDWWQEGYVEYRTSAGSYVFKEPNDSEYLLPQGTVFRPIKTEAEKRRDEQLHQMQIDGFRGCGYSLTSSTEVKICKNLLDAGWIKPKPLTDGVIKKIQMTTHYSPQTPNARDAAYMKRAVKYVIGELNL